MNGMIGPLTFLNPWLLAGLAFLPVLWLLLRVTPPAPKLLRFPAARFLEGLKPENHTTTHTPWWILLLRLMAAALVIIALARPLLNPQDVLTGTGPVRIILDNGWAAGQTWTLQHDAAERLIGRAGRENRDVYILSTAPAPGKDKPEQQGPLTAGQAQGILDGLRPRSWPAAYDAAADTIAAAPIHSGIISFWLSHGLRDGNPDRLMSTLQNQGGMEFIAPDDARMPLLLRPAAKAGTDLKIEIEYPPTIAKGVPVTVQVLGRDGKVLDAPAVTVADPEKKLAVKIDLPPALRQDVGQIRLAGRKSAGAVLLIDDRLARRTVGVVAPAGEEDNAPLIDAQFYLRRALEPYADLQSGTVHDLLAKKPAVMVLPDIAALPPEELGALEKWVKDGGLLLRFAGPNMTQADNFLTPVPLLKGGRALDGALTWDKPPHMAPFPEASPYYGLAVPPDVTVKRQILAQPVEGIEKLTWAALEDGTPLITAAGEGRGLLVLVHTTATPQWSDLALSGLFVQILQRTVSLAGSSAAQIEGGGALQPLTTLDGFGNAGKPDSSALPIDSGAFDKTQPSSAHPPGLYGRSGYQRAFNLGERLPALEAFVSLPSGVARQGYDGARETDLMPWFMGTAFLLFLLDWIIMILLQNGLTRAPRLAAAIVLCAALTGAALPAHAQATDDMIAHAGKLYLAYVKTNDPNTDYTVQTGLESLARVLNQRTSVEPAGVVAVDPAHDELAFYPFLYWPLTAGQTALSDSAIRNVQNYLDQGGTILFDTRDRGDTLGSGAGSEAESLRRVTAGLNIPPLVTMPSGHVLTKSFYLLKTWPGRYDGGAIWVEEDSVSGHDSVSSVIIGSNDWAGGWAGVTGSEPLSGAMAQQQEMAMRFGVNVVMYALTGNYKADQVHLQHILERLGQ